MSALNYSSEAGVGIFKRVYGDKLHDVTISDSCISDIFRFSKKERVGESYNEAFILSESSGVTFGGEGQEIITINDAISMSSSPSQVKPSQIVISDNMSWAFMSRSMESDGAFYQGTKLLIENNLKTHQRFADIAKLYGRSVNKLGLVAFAPGGTPYRDTQFTAGGGNIVLPKPDGTSITFTNGINVGSDNNVGVKGSILLQPGEYAAGIWVGKKGRIVKQLDSSNNVVASGSLMGTDASLGYIRVDFVPVAATALGSHKLCYNGWENSMEMRGAHSIITQQSGTSFGVDIGANELFRGNVLNLNGKAFSIKALMRGVGYAVNGGGLREPLQIVMNPNTFSSLTASGTDARVFDSSYSKELSNGFDTVKFTAMNGLNSITPCDIYKKNDVFGFLQDQWICSGSQAPSFKVNGMGQDIIMPVPNQTAFTIRSYSDQYLFCRAPAKQILWSNANFEEVSY